MKKFASRRLELALGFAGLSLLTSGCGMLPKTHSEPDHVFAPPQMMQEEVNFRARASRLSSGNRRLSSGQTDRNRWRCEDGLVAASGSEDFPSINHARRHHPHELCSG